MISRIRPRRVMRKRFGVGDYRFRARLHREIAQPLRVPLAGFRITNDGSRERQAERTKTARLRELRLAKEAADKEAEPVTKKKKVPGTGSPFGCFRMMLLGTAS
jgi:hypothetical protein